MDQSDCEIVWEGFEYGTKTAISGGVTTIITPNSLKATSLD